MIDLGLPLWLRHLRLFAVAGAVLLVMLILLAWQLSPWSKARVGELFVAEKVVVDGGESTYQMPVFDAKRLHQKLLGHFASKSLMLVSDFDEDWLTLSLVLNPVDLSLLGSMPVWSGWQLQHMRLQPKAGLWSMQLRWQRAEGAGPLVTRVGQLNGFGPFYVGYWQHVKEEEGVAVYSEIETGSGDSSTPNSSSGAVTKTANWRYVGFIHDAKGYGAWLFQDNQQASSEEPCFVRLGGVCDGWVVTAVDSVAVRLSRGDEHGQISIAKSWREGDEW